MTLSASFRRVTDALGRIALTFVLIACTGVALTIASRAEHSHGGQPTRLPPVSLASATPAAIPWVGLANHGTADWAMDGVSCTSATACVAVGPEEAGYAVSSTWNGGRWKLDNRAIEGDDLYGVSCVSPTWCMGVGDNGGDEEGIAATSDGTSWSLTDLLAPGTLGGVSCVSSDFCAAVGAGPTIETWDGSTWTSTTVTLGWYEVSAHLTGVSCVSAGSCTAVGGWSNGSYGYPLVIDDVDGTWLVDSNSFPGDYDTESGGYSGVSCVSAEWCMLAGTIQIDGNQTVAVTGSDGSWTVEGDSILDTVSQLSGVSCTSTDNCTMVGYVTPSGDRIGLVETDNDGSWTQDEVKRLHGTVDNWFYGVSCPASFDCTAVGTSGEDDAFYSTDQLVGIEPDGSPIGADGIGAGSPDENRCPCQAGEPINPITGDFYGTETDLTIAGAGVPLSFTRTYDATVAQAGTNLAGMGPGWTDNFAMNLAADDSDGTATGVDDTGNDYSDPTIGSATITDENGAQVTFDEFDTGATEPTWCPSDSSGPVYCASAPRILATLSASACPDDPSSAWTFVREVKVPETFCFSSDGQLVGIHDTNGDTLTESSYSPGSGQQSCPTDACEAWASSASGQVMVLAFNASSQLTEVFDAVDGGATVTLGYSGTGCSWGEGDPQAVCSITDPGQSVATTFEYQTGSYDMTELNPPTGVDVTNTYDDSGQIHTQTVVGQGESVYTYATDTDVENGEQTTIETFPDAGDETSTTYISSNGVLISQTDGGGGRTIWYPDPASLKPDMIVDPDNNVSSDVLLDYDVPGGGGAPAGGPDTSADDVSSTGALGNETQAAFTSMNEPWCQVDADMSAAGVSCDSWTQPSTADIPGAGSGTSSSWPGATITFYDSAGQVVATTDPEGYTSVTAYTSAGLPYCTVSAQEYSVEGVSCPSTPPSSPPSAATGYTTNIYDSAGQLTSTTDPEGDTTTYEYTDAAFPGTATVTTAPDGTVTTDTLNAAGQVTESVQSYSANGASDSATTVNAYDSAGRLYCTIAPLAYSQGDTSCPVAAPTSPPADDDSDPWPGATVTVYDSADQVESTTNPIGGTTLYGYDEAGNRYCSVGPARYAAGVTCPSAPDPVASGACPPTPVTSATAGATIDTYDTIGQLVEETNPLGGTTTYCYDAAGNQTTKVVDADPVDPDADPSVTTTTTYDADNQVTSTQVGTATTDESYDPDGNVFCTVSANEVADEVTCPTWDPSWATTPPSTPPSDATTTFDDPDGNTVQSTDADGQTTLSAADADGDQYCTVDPVDVADGVTCPAYGASHVTGTATKTFDADGQVLTSTDALGDTTTTCYFYEDASGQCAHGTPSAAVPDAIYETINPDGDATVDCYYTENASEQCATGAPATGGTGGDLYSTTTPDTTADPSGETTTTTYLPGGLTDATTTPAGTTTDGYDAMGDLTSVDYSDTASSYQTPADLTYTYNLDGTRATMADGTGTTTYGYDAMGDTSSQVFVAAGTGLADQRLGYAYFATGDLASITYPSYGSYASPSVDYSYDDQGIMASETDWLGNTVTFGHDADGNLTAQDNDTSESDPDGTSSTTYAYDAADELTSATSTMAQGCDSDETLTQSFGGETGSRNQDGQVTEEESSYSGSCTSQPGSEVNYSYDRAGQVVYEGTSAQGSSPDTFAYDDAGNPTTLSSLDTSDTSDTYTQSFDDDGEVTSQTPVTGSGGVPSDFSYDTLGDQIEATPGSATDTYAYDQTGRMTTAQLPSGQQDYLYDGDNLEAAALTESLAWGAPTSIDATRTIEAVSCTAASFCMAVDNHGNALSFNGTTWSAPDDIDGTHVLNSVSCVSATFCEAVDERGDAFEFDGSSWDSGTAVDSPRSIEAVSCVSTTFCEAVDSSGRAGEYSSSSWSSFATIDSGHDLDTISCATTTSCVAGDTAGRVVTSTGTWGSAVDVDASRSISSVSCATSSFCEAVDTSGYAVTDSSGTWGTPADVDGSDALHGVSCASSTLCEAVDADGNVVAYGSSGWSATIDDIDSGRDLQAVSCPSATFCAAVDGYAMVLGITPQAWSAAVDVDATRTLNAVSCPATALCGGVDTSGNFVAFDPETDAYAVADLDGSYTLEAVSCPTTTLCVGVDNRGYAVKFTESGGTWSAAASSDIDSTRVIRDVSCSSSTSCWAVDGSGNAVSYDPGSGTYTAVTVDSSHAINAVSCPTSSLCVAVDNDGHALTYDGSSWSSASIDGTLDLEGVSCTAASSCAAVDHYGNALTYTPSAGWSSAIDIDGAKQLTGVSCAAQNLCEATDASGDVIAYGGSTWADVENIDGSTDLEDVSCATADQCVAVDASGDALVYSVAVTDQLTWDTSSGSLPLILQDGSYAFIYGPSSTPVEQVELATSTPTYMSYTPGANSWVTTNETGDETGFWSYDAFGTLDQGTPTSSFGYAGQYLDAATGFSDMRARWYDSQTGEFTTVDPDLAQTDQPYGYAGDDPVNGNDPSGKDSESYCISLTFQISVANFIAEGCGVQTYDTQQPQVDGWTVTVGGGLGLNLAVKTGIHALLASFKTQLIKSIFSASGSVNAVYENSNACEISDLGKWFHYASVGAAGGGASFSAGTFWGSNGVTGKFYALGGSIGEKTPFTVAGGETYTWTFGASGTEAGIMNAGFWVLDLLNPLSPNW